MTDTLMVSLGMRRRKLDRTLLPDEWQTPRKRIQGSREPKRIGVVIELSNMKDFILVLEDACLVMMVEVVRTREERYDGWGAIDP